MIRSTRRGYAVAALLTGAVMLAACGGGSSGTATSSDGASAGASATSSEPKGTIAFSYGNESAGIYPIVSKPAKIEAEKRGYKFIEGSANGDCDKQVKDVENFVTQKVDAIVVLPLCGIEPLTPVLGDAKEAGIKIIGYSTEVPNGDSAIVYKNIDGAKAVADEAIRWYNEDYKGDKKKFAWALYTYDQCGKACTDRTDPIREALVAATGVKPLEAESVDETSGQKAAESFLQKNPDLSMVIGINDAGALGAYQAMQDAIKAGRSADSIFIAGMDGQTEALELIAAGGGEGGIYRASGSLILDDLGRAVADLPADVLEGKTTAVLELPYELVTPKDTARAKQIVDTYKTFTS